MRTLLNGFFMLKFGRRGGNRTPNQRFWRPLLYQLSYTPVRWAFRRRSRGPVARPRRGQVKQLKDSLLDDLGHAAGTDGAATFTDREALGLLHGDRNDQVDFDADVVTRHDHLNA